MTTIRIDEIRIRFRGFPRRQARASIDGIEDDILSLLGRHFASGHCDRPDISVSEMEAGTVECRKNSTDEEIRAAMAGRIAGLIGGMMR